MSTASAGAPSPRAHPRTHVHHGQVSRAFRPEAGAYLARITAAEGAAALVERVPEGGVAEVVVALPVAFAAALARDDLTRLHGDPLALVSPGYGVLGVATGPALPPDRLSIVFVSRLEEGHAVEIPASGPGQPSWQLFAFELRA